ncbi:MAG TPA: collagen-like protein, partial [Candidatus Saccharimonadales bacterium]|nr:collagen-like protein [Candidatus Saccharimonadales bacterium]
MLLAVAGLAAVVGGVVGAQMIHGPAGSIGSNGSPGAPGTSGVPGMSGIQGPNGPHMGMLLSDGSLAISDASAVESNCAVLLAPSGCQAAVAAGETDVAEMRSILVSDTTKGLPVAERTIETGLATTLGGVLAHLATCGPKAVLALGSSPTTHAFGLAIQVELYWNALNGCASPASPVFAADVTTL